MKVSLHEPPTLPGIEVPRCLVSRYHIAWHRGIALLGNLVGVTGRTPTETRGFDLGRARVISDVLRVEPSAPATRARASPRIWLACTHKLTPPSQRKESCVALAKNSSALKNASATPSSVPPPESSSPVQVQELKAFRTESAHLLGLVDK